jgi:outer membrane lipoprotein carrier protein
MQPKLLRFCSGIPVLIAALLVPPVPLAAERAAQSAQQAPAPAAGAQQSADAVARAVQQHYDGVRDFTADFTQAYEGGTLRRKTSERGTVLVKKPGKMRWTYKTPEEKLFISDGRKIYFYVPADKQVTVTSMPSEDKASTPILFLVGKGNLTADFTVSFAENAPGAPGQAADSVALRLVPKVRTPDYDSLVLIVDRRTLALRMLIARDAQSGTSTFTFSNLKENVGLSDGQFTFSIPRGADVITQS